MGKMGAVRTFVNKQFYRSLNNSYMRNIKNVYKKKYFFFLVLPK